MEASTPTTAKQTIRQLRKQKAELNGTAPDRKKIRRIQRKMKLLKRETRALARVKKLAAAKAAAEAQAKEAAEKTAAAEKAAEASAG
jgi:TolA-binding protein